MRFNLDIRFSSESQQNAYRQLMSGTHRTVMNEGGSGSGKSYINNLATFMRALKYPETEHYCIKTDLKVLKTAFETSVIAFLRDCQVPEARSRKRNRTYFYDSQRSEFYLGNSSRIFLRSIKSPRPYGYTGDSDILGINGETINIDEATTLAYEWYQFFETRCRSSHGCPPLIALSQNPDARSWTDSYFNKQLDPLTLEPLSETQIREQTKVRIEAYDNVLQDQRYLELLQNSGNALRFYYGRTDDSLDLSQIYRYETEPFPMRMFNIYAMDIGYKAKTAIVQLGFGGDYSVNTRELCYRSGMLHDDIMAEVQKIIDRHSGYLSMIRAALSPGQQDKLMNYHLIPYLIVDNARTDLIEEIRQRFNYDTVNGRRVKNVRVMVLPCLKGEAKYHSIERAKKLCQKIDPTSKFYLNEIKNYRYLENKPDDERIPDGNDDLMDAALYGMRHILEEVFASRPKALMFDLVYQQLYDKIKTLPA